MANLLVNLSLEVKDYQTGEDAITNFTGEILAIDYEAKTNIYRFYDRETNSNLLVSIDYSKEKVVIQERNVDVIMYTELSLTEKGKCNYQIDNTHNLSLLTSAKIIDIKDDEIILEYDLFSIDDAINPLTRNKVRIVKEVKRKC